MPDPPGIGVEINDDFFASHSYTPGTIDIPLREDCSVADTSSAASSACKDGKSCLRGRRGAESTASSAAVDGQSLVT